MTLDQCEQCDQIYPVSGFFTSEDEIPEDMKLLVALTEEQWEKLAEQVPRYGYLCGSCTAAKVKELGI